MHIIFESPLLNEIQTKHVILELDTIEFDGSDLKKTAWGIVETIPIVEVSTIDQYRNLHQELMQNYRLQNWKFCEDAIALLKGRWGGELDSFYTSLYHRIQECKQNPPGPEWSGFVKKTIMGQSDLTNS